MKQSEVIFSKIEGSVSLFVSEVLDGSPILKVVVVCPNIKGLWKTFQELSLIFQCCDNCEHFAISNLIVMFDRTHGLESKGD